MNFDKVVSIITEVSGTQLDEEVVAAFLRIVARGGFRAANDTGGGSTEDIDNIHKRLNKEHDAEEAAKEHKAEEAAKENEAEKPKSDESKDETGSSEDNGSEES